MFLYFDCIWYNSAISIVEIWATAKEMNRLAVGRSARAQQVHKVNDRINWLMRLYKTNNEQLLHWTEFY